MSDVPQVYAQLDTLSRHVIQSSKSSDPLT
jgi:hypothetical protein